jgi:antitoxin CcdA
MLTSTNAPRRRKKATNLSIDHDLLERARRLKLNLSQAVEAGLAEAIRRHERAQWLEKNRAALEAYNEHVEKHGVFSDGLRSF